MNGLRHSSARGFLFGVAFMLGALSAPVRAEFASTGAFNRNFSPLASSSGQFFRNGFNFGAGITGSSAIGRQSFPGLFNQQGNLDLTGNTPQTIANFSRVLAANNQNVGNAQELNLRGFVSDPNSGFAVQQFRLEPFTGLFQSRPADAFGNRAGNFNFGGLDNEALRQASKFTLENLTAVTVNNLEKRLRGFNNQEAFEVLGALNLARQELGPNLSRGTLSVQCQDILKTAVNDKEGSNLDPAYADVSSEDLCIATASAALNHLKPFGKPIVRVDKSMLRNGVLTIPNLLNTFSIPALGVLLKKSDNSNICNFERSAQNPAWTLADLVSQAMNPKIYNLVKGYDVADMNRNLFLETGVNLALPRQFMGALGAGAGLFASNLTDIAFIDGRESGVAKSNENREVRAWANGVGRVFFTFDTNAEKSGVQLASQNVRQTGRNNLGWGQGEGYRQDSTGSIDWFLTAAPDKDGKMAVADEVPATAAHTNGAKGPGMMSSAILAGQCIQCHTRGNMLVGKPAPYTNLNVRNTNGVPALSANFTNAMAQYENYKMLTKQYIPDGKGASKEVLWDTYQKIKQPYSIDYAANQLGMSGNQLRQMMVQDPNLPLKLQLTKDGNLDSTNWIGGGKCAVKFAMGNRRGGTVANGALASVSGPPAYVHTPTDKKGEGETHQEPKL